MMLTYARKYSAKLTTLSISASVKFLNTARKQHFASEVKYNASTPDKKNKTKPEHISSKYDTSIVNDLLTVHDLHRYAVTLFNRNELSYGHTTTNAFEDASFLILHELQLPFQDPIGVWGSARLTKLEREHLLDLMHTRALNKIPTPYLVKGCYQQGKYFYIDERALIPRSYIGEIMFSKTLNIVGSNSQLSSSVTSSTTSVNTCPSTFDTVNSIHSVESISTRSSSPVAPSGPEFVELDYNDYFSVDCDSAEEEQQLTALATSSNSGVSPTSNNSSADSAGSVYDHLDRLFNKKVPERRFLIDTDKVHSVLDLCTGSGCLAILATDAFPHAEVVDAVDLSREALEVAYTNVTMHDLEELVTLYQGDLFAYQQPPDLSEEDEGSDEGYVGSGSYDLIISNPPYVSEELMEALPDEYNKEPQMALAAGKDGLKIVRRILLSAHDHLNDGGGLLCEIGQCKEDLCRMFPKLFGDKFRETSSSDSDSADDGEVVFQHDSGNAPHKKDRLPKVHWLSTAESRDEVFYVEKRFLTKAYLTK